MGKVTFKQAAHGMRLLAELNQPMLRKEKEEEDDDDVYELEDPFEKGEQKCAMSMMFNLIWFMGLSGLLHLRMDEWNDEDDERTDGDVIKDTVQLKAKGITRVSDSNDTYIQEIENLEDLEDQTLKVKSKCMKERFEFIKKLPLKICLWIACFPVQKAYCFVILIVLWLSVLRCFFNYQVGKQGIIFVIDKIIRNTWFLMAASSSTIMFRAGHSRKKLRKFFQTWLRYSETHQMKEIEAAVKFTTWLSVIGVSLGVSLCMGWTIIPIYFLSDVVDGSPDLQSLGADGCMEPFMTWKLNRTESLNETKQQTFTDFIKDNPAIAVPSYLTFMYGCFAWLMTPVFFYLICYILDHELTTLKTQYDENILSPSNIRGAKILRLFESYRARHAGLCDLIAIVDDIFSSFIFISTTCNLIVACCVSYRIIKTISNACAMTLMAPCAWLIMTFSHLTILCVGSGKVNDSAHALMDSVYLTSFKKGGSGELMHKINVFLHKLHGPSIGFTAWNLYVVDRSSMLTVASTFLAYLVVLLTFPTSL